MRMHPVPVARAPLVLHFTYSLFLHAAALSLLVSVPVFGVSGIPSGGGYVVTLAGQEDQTGQGDISRETSPAEDELPDMGTPGPSDIATLSAKGPEPTTTARKFLAEVPSEPPPGSNAAAAVIEDELHKAETKSPSQKGTSKTPPAVKPKPSATSPVQERQPARPDVPEELPDPEPESIAVIPPMFIPAKPVAVEQDHALAPVEATKPVTGGEIAPPKTTAATREKVDANPSSNSTGASAEPRGKDPVGRARPAGVPTATASVKKGGQAGSDVGGPAPGSGTSSKQDGAGRSAKSEGQPSADGDGGVGKGNKAGISPGSGRGYKFADASLSGESGLLRGTGDAQGKPGLTHRESPSDRELKEKEKKGTQETPPVAILVPEALLVQEIRIEVAAGKKELSDISMGLAVKTHPANRKRHARDAERKVEAAEITMGRQNPGASPIKTLALKKAEKGVYIFSLTNNGNLSSVAVVFRLYERSGQERMKEYKSFPLSPSTVTKFRFVMPEALFWDDTDRFSGSIEDSHSVTKFRYETGLTWKEEKE